LNCDRGVPSSVDKPSLQQNHTIRQTKDYKSVYIINYNNQNFLSQPDIWMQIKVSASTSLTQMQDTNFFASSIFVPVNGLQSVIAYRRERF
jgi:hypothetical protein